MINDVVVPQFPLQNDEDLLGLTPVSGVKPHPVRLNVNPRINELDEQTRGPIPIRFMATAQISKLYWGGCKKQMFTLSTSINPGKKQCLFAYGSKILAKIMAKIGQPIGPNQNQPGPQISP